MTTDAMDEKLTLFRGIAVPADEVEAAIASIKTSGINGTEGQRRIDIPNIAAIRGGLAEYFDNPAVDPRRVHADPTLRGTCASGHADGAAYYALKHNATINCEPLVIVFQAQLSQVFVDGRDFLYAVVRCQLLADEGRAGPVRQRAARQGPPVGIRGRGAGSNQPD